MATNVAFVRKGRLQALNSIRIAREQPLFKVVFIAIFALVCEIGLFKLFYEGFVFLGRLDAIAGLITGRLFSLFFLGMGIMLVMSGIITSFATMFRSDEVPYLLAKPLSLSKVVVYKFIESTHFSSWAFVFVIIPYVGAYAWYERLSPMFAVWTLLFSVPFLIVCSGIGTMIIMLIVRWLPNRVSVRTSMFPVMAVVAVYVYHLFKAHTGTDGDAFAMSALMPGMRLASNPLVPSTWVAEGIQAVSHDHMARGLFFLGMISSTACVVSVGVEWLGSRTFHASWEKLEAGTGKRHRNVKVFEIGDKLLASVRPDIRAMIMKDIRSFFRDAMQWSQALIFFGLLALYFANIRALEYHTYTPQWRNMVAFLNVFSVSAVLCSLGSRFVYPQLSLEGQGFWLLGLSPTTMRRILTSKFIVALVGLSTVSITLIWLSSAMLQADLRVRLISLALMGGIACAICGLSTGLGAMYMDLKQRNPAAIVGNFGGTLNLVLGLVFMLATILPVALVFQLNIERMNSNPLFAKSLWLCLGWLFLLTVLTTCIPLVLGIRSLRNRDY